MREVRTRSSSRTPASRERRRQRSLAATALTVATLLSPSCGGGLNSGEGAGSGPPLPPAGGPPELLVVRSRRSQPHRFTEVASSDARGLTLDTVIDRAGVERDCRIAPDGNRLAYSRELDSGDPSSREVLVATLDGSERELRLTRDEHRDGQPAWSPDGTQLAFVSDRFGSGDRLFRIDADGTNLEALFDDRFVQREPDWSAAAGDRIVYSRFDPTDPIGAATLWILDPVERRRTQLTDAAGVLAAASRTVGDVQPCWSPDGSSVLFSRVLDDRTAVLARVDVSTGDVTLLSTPDADFGRPCFAPRADRIFFVGGRPAAGIVGSRLWTAGADGSDPRLLYADARFDFLGLAPLADLPADDGSGTLAEVDLNGAELASGIGSPSQGILDDVLTEDGREYGRFTLPFDGRERAGIDLRTRLPLDEPSDLRRVVVTVRARVLGSGPSDILRIAVRNAVARRNDTVVELPASETVQSIEFTLGGLSYVDRDGGFGVAVIADKAEDDPGELLIDWIGLRFAARVSEPPTSLRAR